MDCFCIGPSLTRSQHSWHSEKSANLILTPTGFQVHEGREDIFLTYYSQIYIQHILKHSVTNLLNLTEASTLFHRILELDIVFKKKCIHSAVLKSVYANSNIFLLSGLFWFLLPQFMDHIVFLLGLFVITDCVLGSGAQAGFCFLLLETVKFYSGRPFPTGQFNSLR